MLGMPTLRQSCSRITKAWGPTRIWSRWTSSFHTKTWLHSRTRTKVNLESSRSSPAKKLINHQENKVIIILGNMKGTGLIQSFWFRQATRKGRHHSVCAAETRLLQQCSIPWDNPDSSPASLFALRPRPLRGKAARRAPNHSQRFGHDLLYSKNQRDRGVATKNGNMPWEISISKLPLLFSENRGADWNPFPHSGCQ